MFKGWSELCRIVVCSCAAVLFWAPANVSATIRYVDAARPDDSGNGLSWVAAEKSLQAALVAANSGDQVWVATGVYKPDQGGGQVPGNRSASFQLETGVAVYGGFAGTETLLSQRNFLVNPTTLSGDLAGDDAPVACSSDSNCGTFKRCLNGTCLESANNGENSYHVVTGSGTSNTAVLDGLTITAGNANGASFDSQGGGLYSSSGSPTVANCTFNANASSSAGAGVYLISSSAKVANCTFSRNSTGNVGGGLLNASGTVSVTNCLFIGNWAKMVGGGTGGGLNYNSSANGNITNCTFIDNEAASGGGMAITNTSNPTVTNCAFSGNSASGTGGAVHIAVSSSPALTNCTCSSNVGGTINTNNAGTNPTVTNCILWGGGNGIQAANGAAPVVNYSIVQGGWGGAGANNLNADPLFVDSNGADNDAGTIDDDLRLSFSSPAVDSANSAALPADPADIDGDANTAEQLPLDLAGNARRSDDPFALNTGPGSPPMVDMGAYERQGNVIYVDASATGLNNGSTWANAFLHLQSALTFAAGNPGINEIWVADGMYMPDGGRTPVGAAHVNGTGSRAATIQLLSGVAIYGGFQGSEVALSLRNPALYETILSGDLLGNDTPVACTQDSPDCDSFGSFCESGFCIISSANGENSFHVLTGSSTAVSGLIDGFTVTAGNANVVGPTERGGGLYIDTGTPRVANCAFRGNYAINVGSGIYNSNSSPTVTNCTFHGNSSGGGGTVYNQNSNVTVSGCSFLRNSSVGSGAGMFNFNISNMNVSNCTFRGNRSTLNSGGAMYNSGSSPTITNCIFTGNSAFSGAGGMYNNDGIPKLTNCTFAGNSASVGGGMLVAGTSAPTLVNCLFSGNSSAGNGGGIQHNGTGLVAVYNCTFANNTAADRGGGMFSLQGGSPVVHNTILWNNSDAGGMDASAQFHVQGGTVPVVSFSIVQGGWSGPGSNNLNTDPLFFDHNGVDNAVGTIDDNLRLRVGSPGISSGKNDLVPADIADLDGDGNTAEQVPLDLAGEPRFNGTVDRGAYEYFADCNNNGVMDSTDIALGTSQDCDPGNESNGIPDECDIAFCPRAGTCVGGPDHGQPCSIGSECDFGNCASSDEVDCADCNLNGVPDACDIDSLTSQDANANGIPDECGVYTGDCIEPIPAQRYWTCPDNWLLSGQYPDDEDSAAGISAILPEGAVVVLDETVVIPDLWIQSGAELQMITHDTFLDVDQSIRVDGTLLMESCRLAANTPPVLTIRAGGRFQAAPCTSPRGLATMTAGGPSTMIAAEIRVEGSDCFIPPCLDGGRVDLDESISFTSTGDLIIDGSMANGSCEEHLIRYGDGNRLTFHTPPSLTIRGSSSTIVSGTLSMIGAPHMNVESSVPVELTGDFENQSVRPDCFHWANGGLTMNGSGQEYEVAATDVGVVGFGGGQVAGGSQTEFGMGRVTIAAGTSVTFRDNFDNNLSGQTPCSEAVYIGSLSLEAGASMTIENCRVYYGMLSAHPSATISKLGCGDLLATPIVPPPQVELDPSGINKTRFISFSIPGGTGETALRVRLDSLHHVIPPYTGGPSVPFTSFEGQMRWAGPPMQYFESASSGTPFYASRLQCTPHYRDWSSVGLLHVTGSAITPSSSYSVENVGAICIGNEGGCIAVSAPLTIPTTRWGDVRTPFNPPDASVQPDISDVSALVDKFRSATGAPPKARALLAGAPGNLFGEITHEVLNVDFGFSHISACVDAFRGAPYPYTISSCP